MIRESPMESVLYLQRLLADQISDAGAGLTLWVMKFSTY